jgi:hypothetical protein
VVAAITAIVVIALGVVTYTLTRGGQAASNSVTAQANANFNHVLSVLPKLGFAGSVPENAASDSSQNCSQTATGDVRQFLTKNPCKEYAVTLIKLRKQGISTQAVITWMVMGTSDLTARYKSLVDERHQGNPPGQPANFNGRCYASGRNGDSAWVAQVQPTGHVSADRQILGAVAPVRLTTSYLRAHCVG